mmetsp:Transcript_36053/g.84536  ORF Transcript_36053/g.84536 Transcript_36053/m.84536 type:complete len:209 (-) Transcript_36053:131-757(-)
MEGVNTESSNTEKMRAHQMSKSKVNSDAMRHEDVDLMVCTDLIDEKRTLVLNASSDRAGILEVLAANPEDKALVSDADEQLLFKVFFKEKVNISAVALRFNAPPKIVEDSPDADETYAKPRLIKIFPNASDMDFGDVESGGVQPASQIEVTGEADTEAKIACVGHKYQRLESLEVLIQEAANPEATRSFINRLSIVGHQAADYHTQYK